MSQYTCSSCGKQHEEWPALALISPDPYYYLSEEEKRTIAEKDNDFCLINYSGGTAYFIRGCMVQKVNDHCDDLEYGVWVSLSEKSFRNYKENFNNPNHTEGYFGWLSNTIPGYEFKDSIPTNVCCQPGSQRPLVFPHDSLHHPFVQDFYQGISKAEAERRIRVMLGEE